MSTAPRKAALSLVAAVSLAALAACGGNDATDA
jgi:predicted small lipoprotein YifL